MATKSICIVGGGIIGLCTAWYARQRGFAVTVLERNGPDHDGCSHGNAGMIVPSHFIPLAAPGMVGMGLRMMRNPRSPFYVRPRLDAGLVSWGMQFARAATLQRVERAAPILRDLNLASRKSYEELSDTFGDFGLTRRGLLMLCKTQHALDEEAKTAETANKLDVPAQVLTPAQAKQTDPDVQMDIAGAVLFPHDCHLSPHRFLDALTTQLKNSGVDVRFHTEVTGWKTEGNQVRAARTTQGEVTADEWVIAGGSWSPTIVRDLRLRIPIQAGKGYSVTVPQPPALPRLCSILVEARVAITPMGDTLRIGGTMELGGMDETVNPLRVQGILESVPRYFPEFANADLSSLPVWKGLRPCSPDGLPYIGRFAKYRNLTAATGHAMMGLSLAPVTGKLVAQVLSGEPTDISTLR